MDQFFAQPILNSPYELPIRHWELDENGQPTGKIVEGRRPAEFITPIPKPKMQSRQQALVLDQGTGLSSKGQQYDITTVINSLRAELEQWRQIPDSSKWHVTPETVRLLKHWRHHRFVGVRPFFCQVEAVEAMIWLTEVAPKLGKRGKQFLDRIEQASNAANPGLLRVALKLATGSGKTTVMAMLIAWQTINAVRRPTSSRFTRGFLIVTPGITIRDRLRVLLPNDSSNYYATRELVPQDLLPELEKARIVITNYHAFKLRERMQLSKGNRALLQGRTGSEIQTLETEGQMLQRVMPELMSTKGIMVLNDEAHHCYREKPEDGEGSSLKGEEKDEAEKNNEAARLWISGLEIVQKKLGIRQVVDLSATPFFLKGSGYAEGTLFPWTMTDFSLMDAIECGIVKLPRVPVADDVPGEDIPKFRKIWEHIRKDMPKKGRRAGGQLDPQKLPTLLKTALEALYGHYAKTSELWAESGMRVPPCFIIVCNNTAASKLVYDYISGYRRQKEDGDSEFVPGKFELFRNYDEYGNPLDRPRTLLIDSEQLESGEALDKNFRKIAADEIERFKREALARGGDLANKIRAGKEIDDATLLREVMNTVGKEGQLGESVRCVVSVSMLTEGWDANNVTHILGVRAFGTQLLCEQVIGRALRRQSYDLNEQGLFNVEYADVLGIPFDFTAKPIVDPPPQPPRETVVVKAIIPERDHLEIRFPRVQGYRIDLPRERIDANFTEDSKLQLTPALVGPSRTKNQGIIGEGVDLTLEHTRDLRKSTLIYHLTKHLMDKWREPGESPKLHLFGQLKRIVRKWLDQCLDCKGGTYPAQLLYLELADMACERIMAAIVRAKEGKGETKAVLDPYNPTGSTSHVHFTTSKRRWRTDPRKCHVNWAVLDSGWEGEFCRVAEAHPKVLAYVKNHGLGFEVPYRMGGDVRTYIPDYIVLVDDGRGMEDPLHLVVEIKGYRGEDAKVKKETMLTYWVPGVNNLGAYGRWAFAEFCDVWEMQTDFESKLEEYFSQMLTGETRGEENPAERMETGE